MSAPHGTAGPHEGRREYRGKPYIGRCDGCETRTPQIVRAVSGSWGVAVVCTYHEKHA